MKTRLLAAAFAIIAAISASAQPHPQDKCYNYLQNISYTSADETDAYRKERCVLDIYYPVTDKGFATLVWFHGGGLEGGNKELLEGFRRQGFDHGTVLAPAVALISSDIKKLWKQRQNP